RSRSDAGDDNLKVWVKGVDGQASANRSRSAAEIEPRGRVWCRRQVTTVKWSRGRMNGVVERVRKWKGEDAVGAAGLWTAG
ncbi:hypothetical protein NEUTE2DRAFT_51867, partial [Neurospora tetrasperma FGSC 2509]